MAPRQTSLSRCIGALAVLVEETAQGASLDLQRLRRDARRAADVSRRVQIPASGFYEWTGAKGAKTPHHFTARDGRPLAFAGIWGHWSGLDGGDDLPNATIIVGAANNWMRRFHERMPVILDWRDAGTWIMGESPGALPRGPRRRLARMDRLAAHEQGGRRRRRPKACRAGRLGDAVGLQAGDCGRPDLDERRAAF